MEGMKERDAALAVHYTKMQVRELKTPTGAQNLSIGQPNPVGFDCNMTFKMKYRSTSVQQPGTLPLHEIATLRRMPAQIHERLHACSR